MTPGLLPVAGMEKLIRAGGALARSSNVLALRRRKALGPDNLASFEHNLFLFAP